MAVLLENDVFFFRCWIWVIDWYAIMFGFGTRVLALLCIDHRLEAYVGYSFTTDNIWQVNRRFNQFSCSSLKATYG